MQLLCNSDLRESGFFARLLELIKEQSIVGSVGGILQGRRKYSRVATSIPKWDIVQTRGRALTALDLMDEATLQTMDILRGLGFQSDPTVISDGYPGLSFDFGNLTLRASSCLNFQCVGIVLFSGALQTPRTLAEVVFELPRRVKSIAQCAAWIVWNLDQHADHRVFTPARPVGWVEEGRKSQRLLPWVMSMAEYSTRPQYIVKRGWLRLAPKTLAKYIAPLSDNAGIVFRLDGSLLSIRLNKKVIALPAEGSPWAVCFRVGARTLRRLPRRLIREDIGVSIWESHITLGNHKYRGTVEEFGTIDPSRVH